MRSGVKQRNLVLSGNCGLCKLFLCFLNKPCEISRQLKSCVFVGLVLRAVYDVYFLRVLSFFVWLINVTLSAHACGMSHICMHSLLGLVVFLPFWRFISPLDTWCLCPPVSALYGPYTDRLLLSRSVQTLRIVKV